jgi:hypothetical protein
MRFIPTRMHGVHDHVTAGVLIAAPSVECRRSTQAVLP